MTGTLAALLALLGIHLPGGPNGPQSCDSIDKGYQCEPELSHWWGQYSPYFSNPGEISPDIPRGCEVTFAQVLARHGARDPTESKTLKYQALAKHLRDNVAEFSGDYAFLKDYEYTLGADLLTKFGQQQMVNAGHQFFNRYQKLARRNTPWVRSAGQDRVVESARNWTQGYHGSKTTTLFGRRHKDPAYPYSILEIPEEEGVNNTLNHGTCDIFENGWYSEIADGAMEEWADVFAAPIRDRLNEDMPGANITTEQTVYMMDMCPFNTVASDVGEISPICYLFSEEEWHQYTYYMGLKKYYGYSWGNPLGPTQGVGFANELIARLTSQPVEDETTHNASLPFPLGHKLYADFTHDSDQVAIYSALGLYKNVPLLPNNTMVEPWDAEGYSVAWNANFAARTYWEKLQCRGEKEEYVRMITNDRVEPLPQCGGDKYGRCKLSKFVESLDFARSNGHWDQCFA